MEQNLEFWVHWLGSKQLVSEPNHIKGSSHAKEWAAADVAPGSVVEY